MINKANEPGGNEAGHPLDFLLTQELNLPSIGETRTGWVIDHRENEILIDIGAKSEGIIPNTEMQILDEEALNALAVGNEVTIYIVDTEDKHGNVVVSYAKAISERDWEKAEKMRTAKELYEATVIGKNKGGILVSFGLLRGFVPNSQLSRGSKASSIQVDSKIFTKVIEVDQPRNRLILSERAASQEIKQAKRLKMLKNVSVGDELTGQVINLADFGAFVELDGVVGLVHLSEISWKRINHPREALTVGDEVKVSVLNVDLEKERLALSIKQLKADPWENIDEIYRIGHLLEATITKITKYGAFARLDDDYQLEGLIHISEISEDHVEHPSEVLNQSDQVAVRIIRIDPEQRQIGLSMKQVNSRKFVEADIEMMTSLGD